MSYSSMHHPSIHRSWPAAMKDRFYWLHSSRVEGKLALARFHARLMSRCGAQHPFFVGISSRDSINNNKLPTVSNYADSVRFIVPFHPAFGRTFGAVFREDSIPGPRGSLQVMTCWSLGSKRLSHVLRGLIEVYTQDNPLWRLERR